MPTARLVLIMVVSAGLFAQTQPANDGAQQDASDPFHLKTTIVVTGTRTQTELQQSPVSTSVLSRTELDTRNTRTLDQGLSLVEGLYSFRSKGSQDTLAGVGMRGFDGRGSNQTRVLILLDGQPINDAYTGSVFWATIPVAEVERVEVARGPFSSLYGGNAMGGVVNILTRPVDHREIEVSGQYGTYNSAEYTLRYSERFWKKLGVTASYQRQQYGGYSTNDVFASPTAVSSATAPLIPAPTFMPTTSGGSHYVVGQQGDNWFNQHVFRSKIDYTFTPKTTASLQYLYRRYGYGYDAANSLINDANGQPTQTGTFFFNDGMLRRFSLTPGGFLSGPGQGVSQIANLQVFHSISAKQYFRLSGGVQDVPYDYYLTPGSTALAASGPGQTAERPSRAWHGDAQWNWAISPNQELVLGEETRHDQSTITEYNLSNWAIRDSHISMATYGRGEALTQAEYVEYRRSLTRRLHVTAGGRLDYWKGYNGESIPAVNATPTNYPDRTTTSLSGKIAAAYDLGSGWTLRGSAGSAFRNPTVYELYRTWKSSTGTSYLSNPQLLPERLKSWEFGLRKSIGRVLDVDAAYYENWVHNLVYRSTDLADDPTGASQKYFNAGQGRTRGAELALRERLTSWLLLRQTYTITDARIVQNQYVPADVGRRVPFVPRNISSFSIMVDRRGWSASINGQYFGKVYSTDLNTDKLKGVYGAYDPFFVADANLSYRFEKFVTVFASAQNILDRRYYEYYLAPGRVVSLGLRFRL
jgi:iron complex outermembrane receptor protein